jgi:hypothetical protein
MVKLTCSPFETRGVSYCFENLLSKPAATHAPGLPAFLSAINPSIDPQSSTGHRLKLKVDENQA